MPARRNQGTRTEPRGRLLCCPRRPDLRQHLRGKGRPLVIGQVSSVHVSRVDVLLYGFVPTGTPLDSGRLNVETPASQLLNGPQPITAADQQSFVKFEGLADTSGISNALDEVVEVLTLDQRKHARHRVNTVPADHVELGQPFGSRR